MLELHLLRLFSLFNDTGFMLRLDRRCVIMAEGYSQVNMHGTSLDIVELLLSLTRFTPVNKDQLEMSSQQQSSQEKIYCAVLCKVEMCHHTE